MPSLVTLHLNDELPKVGSGHRRVRLIKQGPKWTRLAYGLEFKNRLRIPTRVWTQLKRAETKQGE